MELKERIGDFLQQLLTEYGLSQKELSDILDISLGSLAAYIKKKELPRVDIIMKIADIGGITVDDLLKTKRGPAKKELTVNIGEKATVGGGVVYGDVYQNTVVKKIHKYTYEPGDLTEEQASKVQQLINDIVELENIIKKNAKTHAAVYASIRRRFKVGYYRKIGEHNFEKLIAYLEKWKGRLKSAKSFSKKAPDKYKKDRYSAIFAIAKNELGWTKTDIDHYIYEKYNVSSIKNLDKNQLENLYQTMNRIKQNFKK
ncbi:MAG: helix-turn-helix transcriptional regulator [Syntrophorhabdaceae bacterium]|nr:helix-turn-helix transcriptional regulator [Syntrophorhabdaceae bacterium]